MKNNVSRCSNVLFFVFLFCFFTVNIVLGADKTPVYKNPENSLEERVEDLLGRMTLEEKIGQMNQYSAPFTEECEVLTEKGRVGSFLNITGREKNRIQKIAVENTRLGIPLIFGLDVIHGYATVFPIPLGMASSWDPDLVKKAVSIAAREAASDGVDWTFAPMVDIARDARWGRIAEGAGEDPYLGSVIAKAQVEGFQGGDLSDPNTILACAKHFVGYGGAVGGRDYNTVDVSERTLREVYLPPFRAAVVDAHAGTIMSAFNEINGIPATANPFTIQKILREEWSFNGFVLSDWNSIGELIRHGIAKDPAEAAYKAFKSGVDMDMSGNYRDDSITGTPDNIYQRNLDKLVKEKLVSEKEIDEAVKRILKIKFKLGLFERPYLDTTRACINIKSIENIKVAREIARESIILLKNDNKLLPLSKATKSIAIIGPLANSRRDPLGSWSAHGDSSDVVTILEGIRNKVSSKTKVYYSKGCNILGTSTENIDEAVTVAKKCDVAIVVVGEARNMSGEAASRAYLDLPGVQENLIKAIYETGVPVVEVLMNGRPLSISWSAENIPAIVETWFLGIQTGNAIADVLFGDYNPSGKLPVTFPRTIGQVPIYYNYKNTGRPYNPDNRFSSKYIDVPNTPLFPFGHGLSYTDFEYSNLKIDKKKIRNTEEVNISLNIKNTGDYEGIEIVQLYMNDVVSSVTTPVKELKGFKSVSLKPGEEKTVSLIVKASQLGIYDYNMQYVVEPGKFDIMIGKSSENIQLIDSIEVVDN